MFHAAWTSSRVHHMYKAVNIFNVYIWLLIIKKKFYDYYALIHVFTNECNLKLWLIGQNILLWICLILRTKIRLIEREGRPAEKRLKSKKPNGTASTSLEGKSRDSSGDSLINQIIKTLNDGSNSQIRIVRNE